MTNIDDIGDNDSLFGSPPSSPRQARGRSPSLALPGSPSAISAVPKNVGTIALPGSLTSSEPLVNLPASPPRPHITRAQPPRPLPALSQSDRNLNRDRATSVAAAPRVLSKTSKRKAKSTTPKPYGPSLNIPDTTGPLPPNFLRSQQALLGLAGVVAGINPAQLNTRSSRGTSAQNPIVVEDEVPSISNSAWKARQSQLPSNLPVPNEQAIVDTLVAQQNIFPVLRSLLPYFGCSAEVGCCSGSHVPLYPFGYSTHQGEREAPAVKKRKINTVPAGAGDWDVPYPFQGDEGPQGYRQNWEKEREKKLVKELISLIREAVQKAAAKTYVQEKEVVEKSSKKSKPNYKPGVYYKSQLKDTDSAPTPSQDLRQMSQQQRPDEATAGFQPSQSLQGNEWNNAFSSELEALLASLSPDHSTGTFTTGDDFSAIPPMNVSPSVSNSPTLTSSTRLSTPFDFSKAAVGDKEGVIPVSTEVLSPTETVDASLGFDLGDFDLSSMPIDPALLDITSSYMPSVDTPSASSAIGLVENATGSSDNQNGLVSETDFSMTDDTGQTLPSPIDPSPSPITQPLIPNPSVPPNPIPPPVIPTPIATSSALSSASSTCIVPYQVPAPGTATFSNRFSHGEGTSTSARPTRGLMFMPPVTGAPTKKTLDRDEVLRKAKARREQIAAELARAKIELWETTIEQGVLLNLLKDDQLA